VELLVEDIVSAKWPINESELAGIVWLVSGNSEIGGRHTDEDRHLGDQIPQ
jgi:hypothetical protein